MAAKIHELHELHRQVRLFRHGGLHFHHSYKDYDVMIFLHGPAGVWLQARRERGQGSRGRVSGQVGGEGNGQGGKKEGDQDRETCGGEQWCHLELGGPKQLGAITRSQDSNGLQGHFVLLNAE